MQETLVKGIGNDKLFALVLGALSFGIHFLWVLFSQRSTTKNRKGDDTEILSQDLWIETPLIKSEWLSSYMDNNSIVNLKLENLQPSGSFKIRGISSFMKHQYALNHEIGCFVSTSSANAGMAVAYTAYKLNCKCIIILDESQKDNSLIPIFEQFKARIEFYGESWNQADEYAHKLCSDQASKLCYVPMFDHPLIFHGHSSIVNELIAQYDIGDGGLNDNYPDCIIVAVGGGGLINGLLAGLYRVGWSRDTQIVAAQSENCNLFEAGVRNGFVPVPVNTRTCDGTALGYRAISAKCMSFAEKFEAFKPIKSIVVKDRDVLNVCTLFGERQHILIEPLCGVAIAALYQNKEYFRQFQNICIIVCGGNHVFYDKAMLVEAQQMSAVDEKEDDDGDVSGDTSFYDSETEDV